MTAPKMISRVAVVFGLLARAEAVERRLAPNRIQPHSRMLPSDQELADGQFAARQLRAAADDVLAGLEPEAPGAEGDAG